MNDNLPQFAKRKLEVVQAWAERAFTNANTGERSALRHLVSYSDGHFRALFSPTYFALADGATEPTKSQWNTLKKHLKRTEPRLFIFKAHGAQPHEGERCLYVDFGYFAD